MFSNGRFNHQLVFILVVFYLPWAGGEDLQIPRGLSSKADDFLHSPDGVCSSTHKTWRGRTQTGLPIIKENHDSFSFIQFQHSYPWLPDYWPSLNFSAGHTGRGSASKAGGGASCTDGYWDSSYYLENAEVFGGLKQNWHQSWTHICPGFFHLSGCFSGPKALLEREEEEKMRRVELQKQRLDQMLEAKRTLGENFQLGKPQSWRKFFWFGSLGSQWVDMMFCIYDCKNIYYIYIYKLYIHIFSWK